MSQKMPIIGLKEDGEAFTKSGSINSATSSTLLWPLYYCIVFAPIQMTYVDQDGD